MEIKVPLAKLNMMTAQFHRKKWQKILQEERFSGINQLPEFFAFIFYQSLQLFLTAMPIIKDMRKENKK